MRTSYPVAVLGFLFILVGCPSDDDDDDVSGDDDTGDDDTGDDDTGDDDTAPDHYDGYVAITYHQDPDEALGSGFNAWFKDVIVPGTGELDNYELPDGIDECTVTVFNMQDLIIDPGEFVYQSAGTLTLSGPGVSFTLEPKGDPDSNIYYSQLMDVDDELIFEADYDVAATGAEFPGFDLPGVLRMPGRIQLTSPSIQEVVHVDGGLELSWTGGDSTPLRLFLTTVDPVTYDTAMVLCEVADDGSFTVPANVTEQMPVGEGYFLFTQFRESYVEVDGRWILFKGGSIIWADVDRP